MCVVSKPRGRVEVGEGGGFVWGGWDGGGEKMQTTVIEQQLKKITHTHKRQF